MAVMSPDDDLVGGIGCEGKEVVSVQMVASAWKPQEHFSLHHQVSVPERTCVPAPRDPLIPLPVAGDLLMNGRDSGGALHLFDDVFLEVACLQSVVVFQRAQAAIRRLYPSRLRRIGPLEKGHYPTREGERILHVDAAKAESVLGAYRLVVGTHPANQSKELFRVPSPE